MDPTDAPGHGPKFREALESVGPVTYTAGTEKPINKVSADQFGVKSMMMVALYPKSGKPGYSASTNALTRESGHRTRRGCSRRSADDWVMPDHLLTYRNLRESESKLGKLNASRR